jgi:hypothetical protein
MHAERDADGALEWLVSGDPAIRWQRGATLPMPDPARLRGAWSWRRANGATHASLHIGVSPEGVRRSSRAAHARTHVEFR